MHLSVSREVRRLPKQFPVGTTYVVEGHGGEDGHFEVLSRYVVLPGGRQISLGEDFRGPAAPRLRGSRNPGNRPGRPGSKARSASSKKIMAAAGTAGRQRR